MTESSQKELLSRAAGLANLRNYGARHPGLGRRDVVK